MEKSKQKNEPKVEIFGEEVKGDNSDFACNHHQKHGSFVWGLFIISVGVVFLLSNLGALPPFFWSQVVKFWPVIFIFIGLDVMIGRSWLSELLSSLLGLFVFATILGLVFLNVAPDLISGLPDYVREYLAWLNSYIQIK